MTDAPTLPERAQDPQARGTTPPTVATRPAPQWDANAGFTRADVTVAAPANDSATVNIASTETPVPC